MIDLNKIAGYFRFTRSEQSAIVTLCLLLVLLNLLRHSLSGGISEGEIREIQAMAITVKEPDNPEPGNSHTLPQEDNKTVGFRKYPVEINRADSSELTNLYGIGPVYASRIVKFRNLLGGFYKPEQLLEVYGMDSVRYKGFIGDIIIDTTAIVKINLNTAGFRDLLRHPYLDYEEVRSIINFRDYHGPFNSPAQLLADSILPESRFESLCPYLKVN